MGRAGAGQGHYDETIYRYTSTAARTHVPTPVGFTYYVIMASWGRRAAREAGRPRDAGGAREPRDTR